MTTLEQLDEQSRERLIRAAEDSVRGELTRINVLLCEATLEVERLRRECDERLAESDAYQHMSTRALRAEAEVESLRVGIQQLRARLAEESARPGPLKVGPCARCPKVTSTILTATGALCGDCFADEQVTELARKGAAE